MSKTTSDYAKRKNIICTIITVLLVILIIVGISVFFKKDVAADDLFPGMPVGGEVYDDDNGGYTIDRVLIVSRHNIRSPLSGGDSLLSQVTPHEWFKWTSNPGELSVKGGLLEVSMGQYFRKALEEAGYIPENWVPEEGQVRFYANSMQRTISTAKFFAAGLLPVANTEIEYHKEVGEVDEIFCPILRTDDPAFEAQVRKEIDEMGGAEGLVGISKNLRESYELLEKFLDFKDSKYAKENNLTHIPMDDVAIKFEKGEEIAMTGGMKTANSAVDALKLQIYEEENLDKALFGHKMTTEELQKISKIADAYQEICEGTKTLATHACAPMLTEMENEFETPGRRFTFLCGHDSTITSIVGALDIADYELPGAISQKAPIGVKMLFEKFIGPDGQKYMKIKMCYASADQLRHNTILSPDNPPMFYDLKLEGLQTNAEGFYKYEDVMNRFDEAIQLGNKYCGTAVEQAA